MFQAVINAQTRYLEIAIIDFLSVLDIILWNKQAVIKSVFH